MKKIFLIIVFLILLVFSLILIKKIYKKQTDKKNINYVFGYGSLTSIYILKILGLHNSFPSKATLKKDFGHSRYWVEGKNDGVSLLLIPSNNPKNINGVLLALNDDEFKRCDIYETYENNHVKVEIDWKFIDCDEKYPESKLFIYLIKGEPPKKANIVTKMPNLYAQTAMEGFLRYGEDYLDTFLDNTE
jgi:hypothetical protein